MTSARVRDWMNSLDREGAEMRGAAAFVASVIAVVALGGATGAGAASKDALALFSAPRAAKAPSGLDGRLGAVARAGAQALGVARAAGLDVEGARVRAIVESANARTAKASIDAVGGAIQATYAN